MRGKEIAASLGDSLLAMTGCGDEQEDGDCTKRSESANGDGTVPFFLRSW